MPEQVPYTPFPTVAPQGQRMSQGTAGQAGLVAEGIGKIGAGFGSASQDVANADFKRWALQDELIANDANSAALKQASDLLSNFEMLKGDAANAALPKFQSDLETLYHDSIAKMPNLQTQANLSNSMQYTLSYYNRFARQHADSQLDIWHTTSSNAARDNYAVLAVTAATRPEGADYKALDAAFAGVVGESQKQYEMGGYSQQDIDVLAKYDLSSVIATTITSAFNIDPGRAEELYNKYGSQLKGTAQVTLLSKFRVYEDQARQASDANDISNGVEPNYVSKLNVPLPDSVGPISSADIVVSGTPFSPNPYLDSSGWKIGYGSSYVTDANGTPQRVSQTTTAISQPDAEKEVQRETAQSATTLAASVGQGVWAALPDVVKSVLVPIATDSYGVLPPAVLSAVKTGDLESIANAVEGLGKISNADKRSRDAAIIRGAAPPTGFIRGSANAATPGALWGTPGTVDFESQHLTTIHTPSGLSVTVNKVAADAFTGFLADLEAAGYKITDAQGYNDRSMINGGPSQHAFGNAIDINPSKNPASGGAYSPGTGTLTTDLPANIADIAAKWGITWGGDWKSLKDPMHFEFTGKSAGGNVLTNTNQPPTQIAGVVPSNHAAPNVTPPGWTAAPPAPVSPNTGLVPIDVAKQQIIDLYTKEGRPGLIPGALTALNEKYASADATYTAQLHAQQIAQTKEETTARGAFNDYRHMIENPNGYPPDLIQQIQSDTRFDGVLSGVPNSQRNDLLALIRSSAQGEPDPAQSRAVTMALESAMRPDAPNRLTEADQITQFRINNQITKEDYSYLLGRLKDVKTPEGAEIQTYVGQLESGIAKFLGITNFLTIDPNNPSAALSLYGGNETVGLQFSRYQYFVSNAVDAARAAGKSPKEIISTLFNPASPDYLATNDILAVFKTPLDTTTTKAAAAKTAADTTAANTKVEPGPIDQALGAIGGAIGPALTLLGVPGSARPAAAPAAAPITPLMQNFLDLGANQDEMSALIAKYPAIFSSQAPNESVIDYQVRRLYATGSIDPDEYAKLSTKTKLALAQWWQK